MYKAFTIQTTDKEVTGWINRYVPKAKVLLSVLATSDSVNHDVHKTQSAITGCFEAGQGRVTLDAKKMRELAFPEKKFDVFLSHSHSDRVLAHKLARLLRGVLKLKVFVDSDIWWNIAEMQEFIYEKCVGEDYSKRSHIEGLNIASNLHMLLYTSLCNMMLNSASFLFLNTDNSILTVDGEENTASPWIMGELYFSGVLDSFRGRDVSEGMETMGKAPVFLHGAQTEHLQPITSAKLESLLEAARYNKGKIVQLSA